MANTTIAGLTTITGVNIATDDRFIVRDTSANTDFAITAAEMRNMVANAPITLPTVISVGSTSNALRVTQTGTGNAFVVEDSANPDSTPFVIDASGVVISGTTASQVIDNYNGALITPYAQQHGLGTAQSALSISSWTNSTVPANIILHKSRGTTIGSNTALVAGDVIGAVSFAGTEGTTSIVSGFIECEVDATPTTNSVPGRITFATTSAAANTATERMRITSTGFVGIGSNAPANRLHTIETSATTNATIFPLRVEAQTSGTPAIGTGAGIQFAAETTNNNVEIGGTIEAVATTITAAAENFDLVFKTMASGAAAAERLRITSAGALTIAGSTLGTSSTTFNAIDTTATTVNAFRAATALNIGYNSTAASTTNFITGVNAAGVTKTVNIATGGAAGSTTNINIGSAGGGTTTINSPALNISATADTATAATHYMVEIATDGVIRPKTLANVRTEIVTTAAVNAAAATTVGTITSGTWNGSIISGTYGGTGVNNGARTITLGGNIVTANSVTTSGNFALTLTTTAETNVTLPTTGTLATLAGTETLTNKTVNLTSNTLTGTLAQFNAAMSNGKFTGMTTPATFTPTAAAPGAVGFSESNTFAVVTPNATGTYTTTVPAAGVICYLMVLTSGATSFTLTFGTGFRPTTTLATGTVTGKYFTLVYRDWETTNYHL